MEPSAELLTAIMETLRADPGVISAFAGSLVRIYDTPPTNTRGDYLIVSFFQPLPLDGTDGAETEVTIDVWSLTDPPGKRKAMALGAAAGAAVLTITDLPSHLIKSAWLTSSQYQTDATDGVTAHGIVKFEIVTQPKP